MKGIDIWDRSNFLVKQTLIFRQFSTYQSSIYMSFCFSLETVSFTCWEIKSGHSRSHEFALTARDCQNAQLWELLHGLLIFVVRIFEPPVSLSLQYL